MKKFLLSLIAVAGYMLPSLALEVGQSFQDGIYSYQVLDAENNTASLIQAWGTMPADFTIPSTAVYTDYNNTSTTFTVTSVTAGVFQNQNGITKLTVPGSITFLEKGSFSYQNLQEIVFESSEKVLELNNPFLNYSGVEWKAFKKLTVNRSLSVIPDDDNWGVYPLPPTESLDELNLGAGINSLGDHVFQDIKAVKRVNIADWSKWWNEVELGGFDANPYRNGGSDIYVGGMRFTTIELDGLTEIPDYKLAGFKYEGELILPSTMKKIGAGSFYGAKDLYYVLFNEGLEEIGAQAFAGCEALEFDAFPTTLKHIGDCAFHGCDMQKSIVLPEGIQSLGKAAFGAMKGLEKAVLFSNLTELPDYLFYNCPSLEQAYLPQQLESMGKGCFMMCPALEEIILPSTLTKIGDAAFLISNSEMADIMDAILNNIDSVTNWYSEIYFYGYISNIGLKKITFPSALTEIGEYAFAGCDFITLTCNEGLETIGAHAFGKCHCLSELKLPSTLKTIGAGAFFKEPGNWGADTRSAISKVEIPTSVTYIGEDAFHGIVNEMTIDVANLPSGSCGTPSILTLGKDVKTIAPGAFDKKDRDGKTPLRLIRLQATTPPSVSAAFDFTATEYDNITLVIPNGTKTAYERNPRWRTFNMVEESATEVTVHLTGEYPIAEEIRMQSGLMPSRVSKMTVTGVLSEADFRIIRENMLSLYELNISGITNTVLPDNAFEGAALLSYVKLPAALTAIGNRAFCGCTLMDTEALPDAVETIGSEAFSGCSRLSITKLPASLKTIGAKAFSGCTSLKEITAGAALEYIGAGAFGEAYNYPNYYSACTLLEFVDLGNTAVKQIPPYAFKDCRNLTNIVLPANLESIMDNAFEGTTLEAIELPETLKMLGSNVFNGTRLRSVNVPENITQINTNTFSNNARLVSVNFPTTLKNVETLVFDGSLKLSGISCSAIEAPTAATGAFTGIRAKQCSLTVPQQSFRSYLNAPQWGMFSDLFNRLDVEIPEDVDASALPEDEYKEIAEEEELTKEAEESAQEEPAKEPAEPQSMRKAVRAAAKAKLASGANYTRLFDGATLGTSGDSKGVRIFINPKPGVAVKAVKVNGTDVTAQMEGNSLLLTSLNGTLQIISEGAALEDITAQPSAEAMATAYDLSGRTVATAPRAEIASLLTPGIYILRSAGTTEKIIVK